MNANDIVMVRIDTVYRKDTRQYSEIYKVTESNSISRYSVRHGNSFILFNHLESCYAYLLAKGNIVNEQSFRIQVKKAYGAAGLCYNSQHDEMITDSDPAASSEKSTGKTVCDTGHDQDSTGTDKSPIDD